MFHVEHLDDVSRETRERLGRFSALVATWNPRINLVSPQDVASLHTRHVMDCLQLARLIPPGTDEAVDLGSGAGFPGLVLALVTGIPFTLIEADTRKCAFLREAARLTEAPVTILNTRIEAAPPRHVRLITARALAPLPKLLTLCAPFVGAGTVLLLPKGQRVEAELAEAAAAWTMHVERHISRTIGGGIILRLSGVARVQ